MSVPETILTDTATGLLVATGTAVLGLGVAKWITKRWDEKTSRRQRDLATAAEFYRAYGEFYASWKAWDAYSRRPGPEKLPAGNSEKLELLSWVARAEGAFESFLVKLAVERRLDPDDVQILACFRVAYKQLRYRVRINQPLPWSGKDYEAFKGLATYVAAMLAETRGKGGQPATEAALANLIAVTSAPDVGEGGWVDEFAALRTARAREALRA